MTDTMTADELLHQSPPNRRSELVRGRLIVREPAGGRHGAVAARIAYRLMAHVDATQAGRVYAAETGFKIATGPDTVRAPDAAFVARERVVEPEPVGFLVGAPDLVVEVLSPDDRPGAVLDKVGDWLTGGARLVWVIDPERRSAAVYAADGRVALLAARDSLSGDDVLPEFTCPLSELW